jgi:hypothetical protein
MNLDVNGHTNGLLTLLGNSSLYQIQLRDLRILEYNDSPPD